MLNSNRLTLKSKIILISILAIVIIQLISGIVTIKTSSSKMLDNFNKSSNAIVAELKGSLGTPLWNYDFKVAKGIVSVKLKTPEFKGCLVSEIKSKKVVLGIAKDSGTDSISEITSTLSKENITKVDTIYNGNKAEWIGEFYFTDKIIREEIRKNIIYSIISSLILIISLGLVIGFLLQKLIFNRLGKTIKMMEDIAKGEGDLTKRMKIDHNDEIGELSENFNSFVEKIRSIILDVANNTDDLSKASSELATASNDIAASAEEISNQTSGVTSASESSSRRIGEIADKTNIISSQVETIASAIEEMSASLNEVSQNCIKQSGIVGEANKDASKSTDMIEQLQANAVEITKISDVISDIADQTNLLALNATIEAASAGEAGKGFAVVATEVKELAHRTATATGEIDQKIENMKSIVNNTATSIESIVSIIGEINEISTSIASSVEEQSATINEIANSVSTTSNSTAEVNSSTNATADDINSITTNISNIDEGMSNAANSATSINNSVKALNGLSEQLKSLINQFKY